MTFGQILAGARKRLGEDFFLFPVFENQLVIELNKIPDNPKNWRQREDFVTVDNIAYFFACVINTLLMMATSFANSIDDPVYQDANRITETIRLIIQENLSIEIESIEIKSPSKMMAEAGLLKIVLNDAGEEFVQLTDKGRQQARRIYITSAINPSNN